jgi:hypothetical protein
MVPTAAAAAVVLLMQLPVLVMVAQIVWGPAAAAAVQGLRQAVAAEALQQLRVQLVLAQAQWVQRPVPETPAAAT